MTTTGLDFAWSKPSVSAILSAGHSFVCRYLSYDTSGKNLSRAEALAYQAAGIEIVSNWEYSTTAALSGRTQGVKDATEAARQHTACGGPSKAPIYFSCDWDATEAQQGAINAYLDGCASVIGSDRVGVYGSYYVVKRAMEAGKATWGWCTYAWSGGNMYTPAHIYQYHNGVTVGGADCDLNRALQTNYGQWSKNGDTVTALDTAKAVWNTDNVISAPSTYTPTSEDDKSWWPQTFLRSIWDYAHANGDKLNALATKVDALHQDTTTTTVNVDPVAVANQLASNPDFINKLAAAFAAHVKVGA